MRLGTFTILLCFCLTVIAQENEHLKGKTIDITYDLYKSDSTNITIYLDDYKLNDEYKGKIVNYLISCKIDLQGDSIAYVKSKFFYLIDGELYKKRERQDKLKSLNPDKIISFDVYSKNEAYTILGIKTKYGLIKIEEQ